MLAASLLLAAGLLAPPAPPEAAQLVVVFNPSLAELPDPTKGDKAGLGMAGQLFLFARDGKFTEAQGDLYVMIESDAKGTDGKKLITEIYHIDPKTVAKLKTKHERFGDCYGLFLPWPPNWPSKVELEASTQFVPKDPDAKKLCGVKQTILVDKEK